MFSRIDSELEELERIAGFSPKVTDNRYSKLADKLSKNNAKTNQASKGEDYEDEKYWEYHKAFATAFEKYDRQFSMFLGDIIDIMLGDFLQDKIIKEMVQARIAKMRKASEAEAIENAVTKKHNVRRKGPPERAEIGGEPQLYTPNFLKKKFFLASLFLDSDEYANYKIIVKQLENSCNERIKESVPESEEERKKLILGIISSLRYEVNQHDLLYIWKILSYDKFKLLDWAFNEIKNLNLLRPGFYEDLDEAYKNGKKLIKLLLKDIKDEFPPKEEKREAYEDYLNDILEVYTHHHFVIKHFKKTRPNITLKEFEQQKQELNDKIAELRSENESLREQIENLKKEVSASKSECRIVKNENDDIKKKLKKLNPTEVSKQLQIAKAKANAAEKRLEDTLKEDSELRTDMRELDKEVQELTEKLKQLNALPDENAYSIAGLLKGKRVAIFGGVGRDHYLSTLKEAGVEDKDYEWYEGFRTISQDRTAEIVGRVDIAVVITSYAGHLMLFQVRPCIKPNQYFFKIHNSGAGSLRKEILKTFKK